MAKESTHTENGSTQQSGGGFLDRILEMLSLDLRSLALLRIGLGVTILIDLLLRSFSLSAHYTDAGIMSLKTLFDLSWRSYYFSLYTFSGGFFYTSLLFIIAAIFAFCLLIGYRTRLFTILSWIMLISLQARNPIILHGGDAWLRITMFWCMFMPLGARWSVDALMNRTPKQLFTFGNNKDAHFSMASVGFIAQIILIYTCSAILKTGKTWQDGSSIHYVLENDQFITPLAPFLAKLTFLTQGMTVGTFYLEEFGALLLLIPFAISRFRWLAIFLFVSLHVGFLIFMTLGLFPVIAIFVWLALIPSSTWEWLKNRNQNTADLKPMVLGQRANDPLAKREVEWMVQLFGLREEQVVRDGTLKSLYRWWVVDDCDQRRDQREAWEFLQENANNPWARYMPLWLWRCICAILHRLPSAKYPWIDETFTAKQRYTLVNMVAGFFVFLTIWWNLETIKMAKMPISLKNVARYARLDQKWNMFAPNPPKSDGWYAMPGRIRDGSTVDLMDDGATFSWDKPDRVFNTFDWPRYRWRKYLANIKGKNKKKHRAEYGKFICRQYNRVEGNINTDRELETFTIEYVKEKINLDFTQGKIDTINLWKHWCFNKFKDRFDKEEEERKKREAAKNPGAKDKKPAEVIDYDTEEQGDV